MGTMQIMAPKQLQCKIVDARTLGIRIYRPHWERGGKF
jgi:hypothetical protein